MNIANPISAYLDRGRRSRFARRSGNRLHRRFESLEQRLPLASNVIASVSDQLDFQTDSQSMWQAGPESGIFENFSHTLVNVGTPQGTPKTIGQIDQVLNPDRVTYDAFIAVCSSVPGVSVADCQSVGLPANPEPSTHISGVPNPLFAPWAVCMNTPPFYPSLATCEDLLGPAPSSTITVPNPAHLLWVGEIAACELIGFTASECENGVTVGSPPPAYVDSGAKISFEAGLKVDILGDLDVGGGSVEVDYPTQVDVQIIGDAVEPGDVFTITTNEIVGNATMTTDFADIHASLDVSVHARASANVEVKYPSLAPIPDISIGPADVFTPPFNETVTQEVVGLDVDNGQLDLRLLGIPIATTEGVEQDFKFVKAALYIPDLDTTGTINNGQIVNTQLPAMPVSSSGESQIDFAKATIDIDSLLTQGVGGTLPTFTIDNSIPGLDPLLSLGATVVNAEIGPYLGVGQEMVFTPNLMVQFNFSQPTMIQGGSAPVWNVTIPVGQSLDLIHPGGDLNIDPVYTLDNTFHNKTDILLSPKFNYTLFSYSLDGVIPEALGIAGGDALFQDTLPLGSPASIASLTGPNGVTFQLQDFPTFNGSSLLVQASTASATGPASVDEYDAYTLDLAATGPVASQIEEWTIDWGDGTVETVPASQTNPTHNYNDDGLFSIVATATYDSGQESIEADPLPVSVVNADGDLTLTIDDAATPGLDVLIIDNAPAGTMTFSGQMTTHADQSPEDGSVVYVGSIGLSPVISGVVVSDHTSPDPSLQLSAQALSMGDSSLVFSATDVGYRLPAGAHQLNAAIGGNTDGLVNFLEEIDLANTEFAAAGADATAQRTLGEGTFAHSELVDLVVGNHPFSITKTVAIEHTGFAHTGLGSYGTFDRSSVLAPFKLAVESMRDDSIEKRSSNTPRRFEILAPSENEARPVTAQLEKGGNRVFSERVQVRKHDQALMSFLDESEELL